MKQTQDFPYIWCPYCQAIQPLEYAFMSKDHLNKTDAADLLCGCCKLIVATLHERETK